MLIADTAADSGRPAAIMGALGLLVLLLALLGASLTGCSQVMSGSPAAPLPWTIGFWLWPGAPIDATAAGTHPFDVLYVHVGRVDSYFKNSVSWPWAAQIPQAAEYWALWRYDPPALTADSQIDVIARDFVKRKAEASARGQTIVGIQLDYDCPTDDLAQYASFLEKLGKALPAGTRISITALLDWFRQGTRIRELLAHTSEFVPQFYDAAPNVYGQLRGIAEPVDHGRWGPVFNSFGVPYRVGITTFGRIVFTRNGEVQFFRDLAPLDVLGRPGLRTISEGQTPAGEQRSVLRVERPVVVNYWSLQPGDQIELVMPTRSSVLSAYEAAKQMGGFCAGVAFFRWPVSEETLVLNPAQVLGWVTRTDIVPGPPKVEAAEGDCVAVCCWDLQLRIADRLPEHSVTYRIQSSRPLEYFLPDVRIKSRILVSGASSIRVGLPALHGVGNLYLGRAVTMRPAQFTVTEEK